MAEEGPNRSQEQPARDILAAEAFAVPAPDPGLRRRLDLPTDPAGIAEPHDILAAEEFAMPAPDPKALDNRGGSPCGASAAGWAAADRPQRAPVDRGLSAPPSSAGRAGR